MLQLSWYIFRRGCCY